MQLRRLIALAATTLTTVAIATAARGLGPRPSVDSVAGTREPAVPIPPAPAPKEGASPTTSGAAGGGAGDGDQIVERKQRGVALGLFAEDVSFSYVPLLREIGALGATHVALIIPLYQTDGRSADLSLHTRFSPTLELIADTVRAAKRERLEVMLFPIVRLYRPVPGEWRGTLAPDRRDRWFKAYGDLLGDLAAVGAQTGATRLVIGSELSTLDVDLDPWRPLLERVRRIFPGRLVYSANWDHYREARLFDLVDEDGVVGYFNLRDSPRSPATDSALAAAWGKHRDQLLAWHAGRSHPLLFTEVGYRSRSGSTAGPWDESGGGTPDMDEQRRGFAAFRSAFTRNGSLEGAYVWNWYGWGGPSSVGYTPRGKPAAEEVRRLLQDL